MTWHTIISENKRCNYVLSSSYRKEENEYEYSSRGVNPIGTIVKMRAKPITNIYVRATKPEYQDPVNLDQFYGFYIIFEVKLPEIINIGIYFP